MVEQVNSSQNSMSWPMPKVEKILHRMNVKLIHPRTKLKLIWHRPKVELIWHRPKVKNIWHKSKVENIQPKSKTESIQHGPMLEPKVEKIRPRERSSYVNLDQRSRCVCLVEGRDEFNHVGCRDE